MSEDNCWYSPGGVGDSVVLENQDINLFDKLKQSKRDRYLVLNSDGVIDRYNFFENDGVTIYRYFDYTINSTTGYVERIDLKDSSDNIISTINISITDSSITKSYNNP